jgi:hypothetical protein
VAPLNGRAFVKPIKGKMIPTEIEEWQDVGLEANIPVSLHISKHYPNTCPFAF